MINFCFVLIRNEEELNKYLLILNSYNAKPNELPYYVYPFYIYIYKNTFTNLASYVGDYDDNNIIDIERFISRY